MSPNSSIGPPRTSTMIACAIALSLAGAPPARAAPPEALVREKIDAVLQVLRDPELRQPDKRAQRYAKLREIAATVFDWEEMAKHSLGAEWREITKAQRERFVRLFKNTLADYYLDQLDKFGGQEQVTVEGAERHDDQATVKTSVLTASRERVPIHYHMHEQNDRWWIYDVSIEGVSLAAHYRRRFQQFLVNHTFEQLLGRLARPT